MRWFGERSVETTPYLELLVLDTPSPLLRFSEPLTYDKVRIGKNVTTLLPGNFLRFMGRLRSIGTPDREN